MQFKCKIVELDIIQGNAQRMGSRPIVAAVAVRIKDSLLDVTFKILIGKLVLVFSQELRKSADKLRGFILRPEFFNEC